MFCNKRILIIYDFLKQSACKRYVNIDLILFDCFLICCFKSIYFLIVTNSYFTQKSVDIKKLV